MDTPFVRTRLIVSLALLVGGALLGLMLLLLAVHFPTETAFAESLIRLHVLANSNLPQDQDLKLLVRDAVLQESSVILREIKDKGRAQTLLNQNQARIREAARAVITAQGYDYSVAVKVGNFSFPERTYGPLTLPAGSYDAVRVEIGRAQGDNWWCVLFPPLCLAEWQAAEAGETLLKINREKTAQGIAFRFKFWEHLAQTRSAQTIQRWWRVSAANYPLLGP